MTRTLSLLFFLITMNINAVGQAVAPQNPTVDSIKFYGKEYRRAQIVMDDGDIVTYVNRHLHYPDAAREAGVEGKVIVRFLVNEKGETSDIRILRGIGSGCDEEAKRLVASMPKWKPAYYKKRAVKSVNTLPIQFILE